MRVSVAHHLDRLVVVVAAYLADSHGPLLLIAAPRPAATRGIRLSTTPARVRASRGGRHTRFGCTPTSDDLERYVATIWRLRPAEEKDDLLGVRGDGLVRGLSEGARATPSMSRDTARAMSQENVELVRRCTNRPIARRGGNDGLGDAADD